MIYDLESGVLFETPADVLLDEDQLDDARRRWAEGEKLDAIAKRLGAKPIQEPVVDTRHVVIEFDALVATVGEEKARELIAAQGEIGSQGQPS